MATIDFTGQWIARSRHKTTWEGFTASNDVGSAQDGTAPIKFLQVTGNVGSGSPIIAFQGSNNTATGPYVTLNTVTGGAAELSATGSVEIGAIAHHIRPTVSGTTSTTDFDVIMISFR